MRKIMSEWFPPPKAAVETVEKGQEQGPVPTRVPEPTKTCSSQPPPAGTSTSTSTSTVASSSNGKRASASGQQPAASRYLPREVPPRFRQQEQKQLLKRGQPLPAGALTSVSPTQGAGPAGPSPPPLPGAGAQQPPSKPHPAPGLCRPRCALVPRVSALGVVGAAALSAWPVLGHEGTVATGSPSSICSPNLNTDGPSNTNPVNPSPNPVSAVQTNGLPNWGMAVGVGTIIPPHLQGLPGANGSSVSQVSGGGGGEGVSSSVWGLSPSNPATGNSSSGFSQGSGDTVNSALSAKQNGSSSAGQKEGNGGNAWDSGPPAGPGILTWGRGSGSSGVGNIHSGAWGHPGRSTSNGVNGEWGKPPNQHSNSDISGKGSTGWDSPSAGGQNPATQPGSEHASSWAKAASSGTTASEGGSDGSGGHNEGGAGREGAEGRRRDKGSVDQGHIQLPRSDLDPRVLSNTGWGQTPVKQNTAWEFEDSPRSERKSDNGTEAWGCAATQPSHSGGRGDGPITDSANTSSVSGWVSSPPAAGPASTGWGDGSNKAPNGPGVWGDAKDNSEATGWEEPSPPSIRRKMEIDDGTSAWGDPSNYNNKTVNMWDRNNPGIQSSATASTNTTTTTTTTSNGANVAEAPPAHQASAQLNRSPLLGPASKSMQEGWGGGGDDTSLGASQWEDEDSGMWNSAASQESTSSCSPWGNAPKKGLLKGMKTSGKQDEAWIMTRLIKQLTDMGFPREPAEEALKSNNMNLDQAMSALLEKKVDVDKRGLGVTDYNGMVTKPLGCRPPISKESSVDRPTFLDKTPSGNLGMFGSSGAAQARTMQPPPPPPVQPLSSSQPSLRAQVPQFLSPQVSLRARSPSWSSSPGGRSRTAHTSSRAVCPSEERCPTPAVMDFCPGLEKTIQRKPVTCPGVGERKAASELSLRTEESRLSSCEGLTDKPSVTVYSRT
ncbi:hypothetical protein CB1_000299017 [Camelus ferus]|nr:hypothetical protein CB1_000299017 [Camelus ferus]